MTLLQELKRRKVFQVAIAYAIVSWGVIEVIVEIEAPLSLPVWVDTLVIVLLALGFPVAIVLAWALDLTPQGIVKTPAAADAADIGSQSAITTPSSDASPSDGDHSRQARSANEVEIDSNTIAVLPFQNLSADRDDEFLSVGIHGEILNQLTKIKSLRVIARTSVSQFSGTNFSVQEIGSALNAGTIIEGTVQRAGDRLRISARLIDVSQNTHIWSESYDRQMEDIFDIQSDIASRIAGSLTIELSLDEQQHIEVNPTKSPKAYELYLRAMAIYREGDSASGVTAPPDKRSSMQLILDDAISLDPEFALAHTWKAWIYTFSRAYDPITERDWVNESAEIDALVQKHAARALQNDGRIGLAHAAIGKIHLYNRRTIEAEREFGRALKLNVNDPEVLRWCANFNWFVERHSEAIDLAERAVKLDPKNSSYYDLLGRVLHSAGNYADATSTFRESIKINSGSAIDHISVARSEYAAGNSAEALDSLQIADREMPDDASPGLLADLANGFARLGKSEEAGRVVDEIRKKAEHRYVDPAVWAFAGFAINDYERSIQYLLSAIEKPQLVSSPFTVMFIRQNAWADPSLESEDFQSIRTQLGFADQ